MTELPLILAVDDSTTQVMGMRILLQKHGYEVITAANGCEAIEAVRTRRPALVVTDLQMPEMDGLELVDALKQEFPGLPIVLTTAKGSEDIAAEALRRGASSYVPKRTLDDHLAPTISRILSMVDAGTSEARTSPFLSSIRLEMKIENDDTLVPAVIARLEKPLIELGLLDDNMQMQIATALDEALINAILHGNLEISTELRYEKDDEHFRALVNERRVSPPYRDRRVTVVMEADHQSVKFCIRDQGSGFDVASLPDPTDMSNLGECGGRGLLLINAFMDGVTHNDSGNEIVLVKKKSEEPVETS